MKKQAGLICILLTAIIGFDIGAITRIQSIAEIIHLVEDEDTYDELRGQEIPTDLYEKFCKYEKNGAYSRYEYLCGFLLSGEKSQKSLEEYLDLLTHYEKKTLVHLTNYEKAIWSDIKYFPVPVSIDEERMVSFENSWLSERTFGGKRRHEGTDIMASLNERGHYPVTSVSDGTVEKIGWLPQGGYRIGIRSPHGGYFYYAHLYDYADGIKEGSSIKAGEFLGFMGDSGYGKEGTVGKFDVHLHFGIYLNNENGEEFSINSYWILKYLESHRLVSQYD